MNKFVIVLFAIAVFCGCTPVLNSFTLIYTDEGPNREIALQMSALLEHSYQNTEITLVEGNGAEENLDSVVSGAAEMTFVENYVEYREGVRSLFSMYAKILHVFYKKEMKVSHFIDLTCYGGIYIGKEGSPTYNLMMDLFAFYGIKKEAVSLTTRAKDANVIVELSTLLTESEMKEYEGYTLFSFDKIEDFGNASTVEGISMKYPRMSPFVIPNDTYLGLVKGAVLTLSVDLILVINAELGEAAVTDFVKTMLTNRQLFTSIDPLLYHGMKEEFDQDKLNIPLHSGATLFFQRYQPSFIERYAELGGVVLSLLIAVLSGLLSLVKWHSQKKKDKIDDFYAHLIRIKNKIEMQKEQKQILAWISDVNRAQNKAFEMLISEELVANESFRIYMELSKETILALKHRLKELSQKVEEEG